MSGRQFRAWPLLDLSAIGAGVQTAVRKTPRPPKRRKESAFVKACKPTSRHREDFEARYLDIGNEHVRFHVRRIGHDWEVWDTQSSDVYGPFKTHADAWGWVRRQS